MKNTKTTLLIGALAILTGCPPPSPNQPQGGSSVDPKACGQLPANDVSRKIIAFLEATVVLNREVKELDAQTKQLCVDMGKELGISVSGDTKTICDKVSQEIKGNLNKSLKPGATLVTKHKPSVCRVDLDAAAKVQAECEAKAQAEIQMTCKGTCQGTCNGKCVGTCTVKNADGSCAGQCQGTCEGSCSGSCEGSADASGSVECQAQAEVTANLEAQCTPPELTIVFDPQLVVDQATLDKTVNAIKKGLPGLLALSAKLSGPVVSSVATFTKASADLVNSAGNFTEALGAASVCVLAQLTAAASVVASVQVTVQVDIEASASVGGSCGATTN